MGMLVLLAATLAASASTPERLDLLWLEPTDPIPVPGGTFSADATARLGRARRWHHTGVRTTQVGLVVTAVGIPPMLTGHPSVSRPARFGTIAVGVGATAVGGGFVLTGTSTTMGARVLRQSGVRVPRAPGYVALAGVAVTALSPFVEADIVLLGPGTIALASGLHLARGAKLFSAWDAQRNQLVSITVVPHPQRGGGGAALVVQF